MPNDDRKLQGTPPKHVAICARYSSDLQRPSSIEDQMRQCRDAAARNGWVVVDEYIRSDAAVSGRSLVGRNGLDELVKLAEQPDCLFDGILIDDGGKNESVSLCPNCAEYGLCTGEHAIPLSSPAWVETWRVTLECHSCTYLHRSKRVGDIL
ncbi:MAG: recombinase family protein [Terracidiphilus sp.]|jgi:hypothetical protein